MTKVDWIIDEQLKIATNKAIQIFDDFCKDKNGEESLWTGIEIDGKEFDINCFDWSGAEDGNYRDNSIGFATCSIYPTKEVDGQTETDGDNYITVLARICGITYKLQEINDDN